MKLHFFTLYLYVNLLSCTFQIAASYFFIAKEVNLENLSASTKNCKKVPYTTDRLASQKESRCDRLVALFQV